VGKQVLEIPLNQLSPESACHLADNRWTHHKGVSPLPFNKEGLERNFRQIPRTVGRTLSLLQQAIEMKLVHSWEGDPWPADEGLGFSPDQIDRIFQYLDKR